MSRKQREEDTYDYLEKRGNDNIDYELADDFEFSEEFMNAEDDDESYFESFLEISREMKRYIIDNSLPIDFKIDNVFDI